MNLDEINEKLDRLEKTMYMSQRPIHYVDHYDRYQPDYQDTTMEGTQSNQQGQGWYQSNFGDQWYDHGQMSNQNRGYTSWNNQGPSYNSYDPQGYNNYAPQEYDNYASQQQFNDFEQWEDNSDESSQDDEIKDMLKQILEGQERETNESSDLKSRLEGLETHVKELENQIAQAASTFGDNEEGVLPEKPEANPKDCCQEITLRSVKELPSGDKAEGKSEKPEEEELSVDKEAENEVLAEDKGSEKKDEKQAQEAPKTEEKTEHLPPYDSEVLKEEDSQQKVLEVKQDGYGLLDDTCVGYEKMMDSHIIHDEEASFLEMKEELNVMDIEEASNGKTSMESDMIKLNPPKVLERHEETSLVLNWEKCHFMVMGDIVLGHKISERGIEVDKEKVEVIVGLEPPTAVREVISFLVHANFHRWPFKDSSRDAKPFTQLLCKETTIKKELVDMSIVQANDWSFPFEPGGDFTVKIIA